MSIWTAFAWPDGIDTPFYQSLDQQLGYSFRHGSLLPFSDKST
jgi:hypothetical protein